MRNNHRSSRLQIMDSTTINGISNRRSKQPHSPTGVIIQRNNNRHRMMMVSTQSGTFEPTTNNNQQRTKFTTTILPSSTSNLQNSSCSLRRQQIRKYRQQQRNRRQNLWNLFQTYCSEMKELKNFFEMKFSKLKIMEEKINDFLICSNGKEEFQINNGSEDNDNDNDINIDDNLSLDDVQELDPELNHHGGDHRFQYDSHQNNKISSNNNDHDSPTNNLQMNNHLEMFEPIIDIQIIKGEDNDEPNTEEPEAISSLITNRSLNSTKDGEEEQTLLLISALPGPSVILPQPSTSSSSNRISDSTTTITRKGVHNIHSKNEFMQVVERYKQEKSLIREKVSSNVYMLRHSHDNSIVGYQCSIDNCPYMHFLRAQVNRHYKNFHSKTCTHCNQRFKRPYELSLHLKELNMDMVASNDINNNLELPSIHSGSDDDVQSILEDLINES